MQGNKQPKNQRSDSSRLVSRVITGALDTTTKTGHVAEEAGAKVSADAGVGADAEADAGADAGAGAAYSRSSRDNMTFGSVVSERSSTNARLAAAG